MGDVCDQVAAAELVGRLRQAGLSKLLEVLGSGAGRTMSVAQLARRMKVGKDKAVEMLARARAVASGSTWPPLSQVFPRLAEQRAERTTSSRGRSRGSSRKKAPTARSRRAST